MQFTAKTVEEATASALKELAVEQKDVKITVIEEPVKGLFGRLKGQAVIEVEVLKKQTEEERTVKFVQGILDKMDILAVAKLQEEREGKTVISLVAEKSSPVIGYRGEVLDAIQTLAGAALNIGRKDYKKVVVDCEGYREKREETLVKLARKLEQKATEMRREVVLEAMSPYERRIIHTELANSTTVITTSEGKEPNRYVVIVPNDKDEFAKPYNAGRNNGGKFNRRGGKNFKQGGKNNRRDGKKAGDKKGGSGFIEQKKKSSSGFSFGTYLGNSKRDV